MAILKDFRYHAPADVQDVLRLLAGGEAAVVLAGGTFVLNYLKKAARPPSDVVGLKKIASMRGIHAAGDGLEIGAMTTIAELAEHEEIEKYFPSLREAALKLGTSGVRNMATLGGNVASRFFWADMPAVLMSLGAELIFETLRGERRMSIGDFLEEKSVEKSLLTRVRLPEKNRRAFYFRHTRAMEVDVPYAALAFSCRTGGDRMGDVRCVVNTASSFPVVLKGVEKLLEGKAPADVRVQDATARLAEDLRETGLQEHRCHLLSVDVEDLVHALLRLR